MTTFAEINAQRKPRETFALIAVDGETNAQIERLEREHRQAERLDRLENRIPEAPKIAARLDELRSKSEDLAVEFRFRALPRKRYRKLIEDHPAKKDSGMRWNEDTFAPALITACCVHPEGTDGQVIWDEWDDGVAYELYTLAVAANEEPSRVPFSVTSTAETSDSGTSSTTAANEV